MVTTHAPYQRITTGRAASIREETCRLLNKVYARRDEFLTRDASPEEVVSEAPEIIIENFFGYTLVKLPEIPSVA